MKFRSIDLFAGAGGLSEGLKDAGFNPLYANEIVHSYADTYSSNHPEALVDIRDIRSVDPAEIRSRLDLAVGELDLIAGGPPCQGFSINAPKRSTSDQRNHLFRDFLKFVAEFQPRAVLIENVPGLVSFDQGRTLQSIFEALREINYSADVRILYAPHYGVPQTRWRTFILAFPVEQQIIAEFPEPERDAPVRVNFTSRFEGRKIVSLPKLLDLPQHTTVGDALSDLPLIANGQGTADNTPYRTAPQNSYQQLMRTSSTGVYNHIAPRLSDLNMKRFAHIPPGGNWTNIPSDLLPEGMKRARRTDHTKRYGRVRAEGLASTILTKCDPHWGAFIHYEQDRAFTVREAARLQSFPDSFLFGGTAADQYAQVGNAVPPLLARRVGDVIATKLESISLSEVRRHG